MLYGVEDFHPNVSFTENLLLKIFDPYSPQAERVDSFIFYPFSYRATQSMTR